MIKFFYVIALCFVISSNAYTQTTNLSAICDEWPPYQYIEDDEVKGYSVELANIIFARLGYRLSNVQAVPWKRAMQMIKRARVDILFSGNYTDERTKFVFYPKEPLVLAPWLVWVKKGSGIRFNSFEDLKGKRIGVVGGYSYTKEFWDFAKKNDLDNERYDEESNFRKLFYNRLECTIAELGNGAYVLNKLGYTNIIPLRHRPIKVDGLYVLFSKARTSQELADRFSQELLKFKGEAEFMELFKKYFKLNF